MSPFYGNETHSIDHKGRLSVPASMRREVQRRGRGWFMLARGLDGCLALYSPEGWSAMETRLKDLPFGNPEARAFVRAFLRHVVKVTVDAQGRITLPPSLMSLAGLGREAVLQGAIDRIEIWDPERFRGQERAVEGKLEDFAANLMGGKS